MANLKEIIYQIKNLRSGGIQSDDVKISDEQIADSINYYRAKLIRQEIDRGKKLDPMVIQPLYGQKVERVKFDRGQPLSGKTVFRTVNKLPRAIESNNNNLVTFVGHNLLGKAFQRSTPYNVHLLASRAITGLEPKWFEFDNRIYVVTEDSLTDIVIQLVAENPLKIAELNGEVDVFDPLNIEYPISDTMRDTLYKLMTDMELKLASVGTDDINDGLDKVTDEG